MINSAERRPGRVALVPHTHWDREWYEPFQRFRMRLVDVVDDVLVRAEADAGFRFTFDGQMAAVEDYLEVRPENRQRVADLVRRGQFAIGPWRVLLDEFLCSGENIIRNLQLGHRQAQALGGAMDVGYLPDMFGHIAQMPQILRAAGISRACVYRGVPQSVTRHRFRWMAPDGTGIGTEYLIAGYGNVSDLFDDPADLAGRLDRRLGRFADAFRTVEPGGAGEAGSDVAGSDGVDSHGAGSDEVDEILAMYGTDHSGPLPTLMGLVRRLADQRGGGLRVATLAEYLAGWAPEDADLPVLHGELRSHARANILPGVISIRPHLKHGLAAAECMVERYAEPVQALWGTAWPSVLLELAWTKLVDCSCHDSVTGCGVDDTAVQVAARIAEAGQIGQAVRDDVTAALSRDVPTDAVLVVNPSPRRRSMVVTATLPAPVDGPVAVLDAAGNRCAAQQIEVPERVLADEVVDAGEVVTLFRRVHDRELFGRQVREVSIDTDAVPPCLTFAVAADPGPAPWDVTVQRARAAAATAERPGPWRVRIADEPRRTVAARVDVPALGLTSVRLVPAIRPEDAAAEDSSGVTATVAGLAGAGITVAINADGTLRVSRDGVVLDGVGALVDGGDAGDSYNYAPPAIDAPVGTPDSVDVQVLHSGPVVGAVLVRRRYRWPVACTRQARSTELVDVDVDMTVELRAAEPFVRLEISFDNRASDHRLRLHVPCARPAGTSHAAGQFAVVERDRHPEAGPVGEFPIATYPASSFVDAGGAGVLLTGPTEYELLADPDVIALTVLRSVGYLSRNRNALRDEPAGPQLPTPLGQSPGRYSVRFGLVPHPGDWRTTELAALAEDFVLDPVVSTGSGPTGGPWPAARTGLELSGDGAVLSAVVAGPDGSIDVRLVAMTAGATDAVLVRPGRPFASATAVDLLGRPIGDPEEPPVLDDDGRCRIPLRSWQIRTVRLG
jgi:alpha-mannosidase